MNSTTFILYVSNLLYHSFILFASYDNYDNSFQPRVGQLDTGSNPTHQAGYDVLPADVIPRSTSFQTGKSERECESKRERERERKKKFTNFFVLKWNKVKYYDVFLRFWAHTGCFKDCVFFWKLYSILQSQPHLHWVAHGWQIASRQWLWASKKWSYRKSSNFFETPIKHTKSECEALKDDIYLYTLIGYFFIFLSFE